MEALALKRGLALILVVGVLAVLAVLGSAFAVLSRLERRAAHQRILGTQALLLSRSGIEDATARLAMGQDPDLPANLYGGEDWDLSGGALSALESANEVYRPGNPDREACPVSQAMRPSFFERISSGNPVSVDVNGRRRGVSGRLSTGTWALKVIPQAGFFVNGGDPAADPTLGYNAVLKRMLGTLAKALDREDGVDDGLPVDQADGENLIALRPPTPFGWESWEQIKALALGGSQAKLDALRPYLALHAWVDRKVVAPNLPVDKEFWEVYSWTYLHRQHRQDIPGSLAPRFEARAPVSLQWARKRRPALIALLAGLKALYVDEAMSFGVGDLGGNNDLFALVKSAEIALDWTAPTDDCRHLADQILSSTSELASWQQWNSFCDALDVSTDGVTEYGTTPECLAIEHKADRRAKRDILKANFNPDTDLNRFNPNATEWKSLDKSDLLAYSTELSLFPVHGYEVECWGRILGRDGRTLAARTLKASISGPAQVRLTTQKEFVCSDLGDLNLAGDETGVRLPGQSPFVSLNRDGLAKTWGHRLAGLDNQGVAVQTYPEPVLDTGAGPFLTPADSDGNLQLATIETPDEDFYSANPATRDMTMLAPFTTNAHLALADAWPANPLAKTLQTSTVAASSSLFKPTTTGGGRLRPDGAYSDRYWAPAWLSRGSFNGFHGVVSFWVKRNYELPNNFPEFAPWGKTREWVKANHHVWYAGSIIPLQAQYWVLGDFFTTDAVVKERAVAFLNESVPDEGFEIGFQTAATLPEHRNARRWSLITLFWDVNSAAMNDRAEIFVNDGDPAFPDLRTFEKSYRGGVYAPAALPCASSDLTTDDYFGPHVISLGYCAKQKVVFDSAIGADSTFDEFAVYDFGGAPWDCSAPTPADAIPETRLLALNRFREGRYYRKAEYRKASTPGWIPDEAASWVSAPIRLPSGASLKSIHWTWYRPRELPDDYPEVELLTPAADAYVRPDVGLCRSTLGPGWTADRQEWNLPQKLVPDPAGFRLRVVFRRKTPVDVNIPILESPVLDDLTLLYEPKGGPRLLDFRAGE